MRKNFVRALAAVGAGAAVSVFGVTGADAAAGAARSGEPAAMPTGGVAGAPAGPGTQLWVQHYAYDVDYARALAVSPTGNAVYVTGESTSPRNTLDDATVAYDPATGTQLWAQRYNAGGVYDFASSVAVSPSGSTVFVTGRSELSISRPYNFDCTTIAYDAATGAQKWVARYNGPGNGGDGGASVTVSPSGGTVFVTGYSKGTASGADYATIAYDTASGARKWVKRYNGPGNGADKAASVTVSPSGGTVFVTGYSKGTASGADYATIAYSTATGAGKWVKRYNGPGNGADSASSVAVSPIGTRVFITGKSRGRSSGDDYATVAYSTATGAGKWVKRYNGPGNGGDGAVSVGVSPSGGTVFVTGSSTGATTGSDYATVAYSAATGAGRWVERYANNSWHHSSDSAVSLAVSPTGSAVYVTGTVSGPGSGEHSGPSDYVTLAYNAASGTPAWGARYDSPVDPDGDDTDYAVAIGVSPTSGTVFVTGSGILEGGPQLHYGTVAYSG